MAKTKKKTLFKLSEIHQLAKLAFTQRLRSGYGLRPYFTHIFLARSFQDLFENFSDSRL